MKREKIFSILCVFCIGQSYLLHAAETPEEISAPAEIPAPETPAPEVSAPVVPEPIPAVSRAPALEPVETITPEVPAPAVPEAAAPEPTVTPAPETPAPVVPTPEPMPPVEKEETTKPEKVAPVPSSEVSTPEVGIDTIDIEEGGNWLLKREALEKTVNLIEEINGLFTKIIQASTDFKINRNKLDNEYEVFSATIGFNLGDFDQLMTLLVEDLDREQQRQGDSTAGEREIMLTINEKKKELEQLQADLKALESIDEELDTVISTVDNQIKTANNYQTQAWKNFQMIKKVLSDEKVDELYYQTSGLYKNMQEIYTYLTQTLTVYFSDQMQVLRNQTSKIQSGVQSLQQKGVDLKERYYQLQQQEEQAEKQALEQETQQEIKKALEEAQQPKPTFSLWQRLTTVALYPLSLLRSLWNSMTGWLESLWSKKPQIEAEPSSAERDLTSTSLEETPTVKES